MKIKGIWTALVSPFSNGEFDKNSFQCLLENQIKSGVDGFVLGGTTAESPTLKTEELLWKINCLKSISPKVPFMVGTGSNCTEATIEKTRLAERACANAALVVVPYYNKPSQEGMFLHFKKIHDHTEIPIVLYNVPGRTSVSMSPETVARLAALPRVVGLKDATGDFVYFQNVKTQVEDPHFSLLSGDDMTLVPFFKMGGDGAISVMSHIFPRAIKSFYENSAVDLVTLRKFLLATEAVFSVTNPVGVKMALKIRGVLASDEVRLPLAPGSLETFERIRSHMSEML